MKNSIIGFLGLILLFACKTKEVTQSNPEFPKPYWVESRPINNLDYIGIGVAKKAAGVNFIEVAKNNALSDLASEIKVNLESNTVYYQTERGGIVNEDFRSTITTSAAADIEGYEMLGSWQNEYEYWVYYKLSKADYLRRVEEKRVNAKKASLEHLSNAKLSQDKGDIKLAIQHYFDSFSAIQAYPPSSIEVTENGKLIFLDNVIYSNIQQLFSAIEFGQNKGKSVLDFENRFSNHEYILISYNGNGVKEIPLIHRFYNQYGAVKQSIFSNENGIIDVLVKATSLQPSRVKNDIYLDLDQLIGNRSDAAFIKQKVAKLVAPRYTLEAEVVPPKLYMNSRENSFGKSNNKEILKSALVSELAKEGILIVDTYQKADLIAEVKSDTKLQSKDANFTAVGLSYSIVITEKESKKTVLSLEEGPLKGVSLDEERAAVKAYEKAEGQLKRVSLVKIKSAILDF